MFRILLRAARRAAAVPALLATGAALAGAGDLATIATPLQANVTFSTAATAKAAALEAVVGYEVRVVNNGGNTINNIRFTAGTTPSAGAGPARFLSTEGGNGRAPGTGTTIQCSIGQLKAGQAYPAFTVFFESPQCVASGGCPGGATLAFTGLTLYAEGTGGLDTSVPPNSSDAWAAGAVSLGTFNPTLVRSAIRRTGGKLFTGDGLTTGADTVATAVEAPPAAAYSRAEIVESDALAGCQSNALNDCLESRVSIVDENGVPRLFSPNLQILLRVDISKARLDPKNGKPPAIASILLEYTDEAGQRTLIGPCASPTAARSDGIPCIAGSQQYERWRPKSAFPQELELDYEWRLLNIRNGSYKVF